MKNLYPILLFLSIGNMLTAQVKLDLDTLEVSKAEYSEGDPWQILSENIDYPLELAKKYIQGDVIISLIITKNGTIDSIKIINSPHHDLSVETLNAFKKLDAKWVPSKMNGEPVCKRYYFIIKYRLYSGSEQSYTQKANQAFEEKKYKKTLRYLDKAVKDNYYNEYVFSLRSTVNQELGNIIQSQNDLKHLYLLQNNVMLVIEKFMLSRITNVSHPYISN